MERIEALNLKTETDALEARTAWMHEMYRAMLNTLKE